MDILNHYKTHIDNNYLHFLKLIDSKYEFLHPVELKLHDEKDVKDNWKNFSMLNLYLRKYSKDMLGLGREIVKVGSYFPIMTTSDNVVLEGKHRIWSLQKLDELGELSNDFKILCLKCDKYNPTFYFNKKDTSIEPYDFIISIDAKKRDEITPNLHQMLAYKRIDKEFIKYTVDKLNVFIYWMTSYNRWLTEEIFQHNEKNKNKILPNQIVKDKREFRKWIDFAKFT